MNRKNFGLMVLTIMSILSVALILSTSAESGTEEIGQSFSFTEPEITEVNISNITYHKVAIQGLPTIDEVGEPILPVKPLRFLLPQKGVVESINISYGSNISLGNGFNVIFGKEPINNFTGPHNETNESYFDPSIPYPTTLFSPIGIQDFRGYSILVLNLYPVHYIYDTGEVYYYDDMTVTIKTNETGSVSPLFRGLERDELMMKQR
jgi:hypothetical protein